jgi:hypothetical protein
MKCSVDRLYELPDAPRPRMCSLCSRAEEREGTARLRYIDASQAEQRLAIRYTWVCIGSSVDGLTAG